MCNCFFVQKLINFEEFMQKPFFFTSFLFTYAQPPLSWTDVYQDGFDECLQLIERIYSEVSKSITTNVGKE